MREIKSSYDRESRKFVIARSEWGNGSLEDYQNIDAGSVGAFACVAESSTLVPWDWDEARDEEKLPEKFLSCCVGIFLQCVVPDLHPLSILNVSGLAVDVGDGPDHFRRNSRCLVEHGKALTELGQTPLAGIPGSEASSEVQGSLTNIYGTNDQTTDGYYNGGPVVIEDKEAELTDSFKEAFNIELSFID